ncbi:hypothetical protein J5N97_018855 [Dioscorea zingiberensis]|uniref:Uncharacterized protein n=1 Tax=Dioscorea zingiberensis TaxID=325984 RepID=A0A9D5CCP3_9LILI|nr:hypothetical protein J5N97_018855 [Dioscorea zingiberensis]
MQEENGNEGEIARDIPIDMRKNVVHNVRKRPGNLSLTTIDDIDQMMSDNVSALETFVECDVEVEYDDAPNLDTPTSQALSEAPVSRIKRSKKVSKDDALDVLKSEFNNLAKAMSDLSSKPPVTGSELWELISSLGLEAVMESKVYLALLQDREMLTGFISLPPERRKDFLLHVMFGALSDLDRRVPATMITRFLSSGKTSGVLPHQRTSQVVFFSPLEASVSMKERPSALQIESLKIKSILANSWVLQGDFLGLCSPRGDQEMGLIYFKLLLLIAAKDLFLAFNMH